MILGNTGWLCPKCQSAHAPDVKTCPAPWVSFTLTPGLPTLAPSYLSAGGAAYPADATAGG